MSSVAVREHPRRRPPLRPGMNRPRGDTGNPESGGSRESPASQTTLSRIYRSGASRSAACRGHHRFFIGRDDADLDASGRRPRSAASAAALRGRVERDPEELQARRRCGRGSPSHSRRCRRRRPGCRVRPGPRPGRRSPSWRRGRTRRGPRHARTSLSSRASRSRTSELVSEMPSRPDSWLIMASNCLVGDAGGPGKEAGKPGVDVSGPGAHDQARGRGQGHGRVDRPAPVHGRHAGPVPQMGQDDPTGGRLGADGMGQGLHQVGVGEPVEPVSPHAGRLEPARDRHDPRDARQVVVERRVEAGHLRDLGQPVGGTARPRRSRQAGDRDPSGGFAGGRRARLGVMRSGPTYFEPPCTMRWATPAIAAQPTCPSSQSTSQSAAEPRLGASTSTSRVPAPSLAGTIARAPSDPIRSTRPLKSGRVAASAVRGYRANLRLEDPPLIVSKPDGSGGVITIAAIPGWVGVRSPERSPSGLTGSRRRPV